MFFGVISLHQFLVDGDEYRIPLRKEEVTMASCSARLILIWLHFIADRPSPADGREGMV